MHVEQEAVVKLQHHLGGLEGLGPVAFEKRVFVEEWEKRRPVLRRSARWRRC